MMYDVPPPEIFPEIRGEELLPLGDQKARGLFLCQWLCAVCIFLQSLRLPVPFDLRPVLRADDSPEFVCKMKPATDWSQSAANPIVRVILRSKEVDGRSLLIFVGFVTGFIAAGSFVRLVLAVSTILSGSAVYRATTGRTVLIVFRGRSGLVAVSWFRR